MLALTLVLALTAPRQIPVETPIELIGKTIEAKPMLLSGEFWSPKKPSVLYFYNRTCKTCIAGLPAIQTWQNNHPELEVYLVSVDRDEQTAKAIASRLQTNLPVVLDSRALMMGELLIGALPTLVVVDKNYVVKSIIVGFRDGQTQAQLEEALDGIK